MKTNIESKLQVLKNKGAVTQHVLNKIEILSPQELAPKEGQTVEQSIELWGEYVYAVLYSDFPDYCFIKDKNITEEEIEVKLAEWMQWVNVLKQ